MFSDIRLMSLFGFLLPSPEPFKDYSSPCPFVQSGRAWTLWDRLLTPWPYVWVIPWKHREALGGHLFRVMVLIFGVVAVAVPYFGTNIWAETFATTVWDPEIALDRQIPVIGWMIAPYMALYLFWRTLLTNTMDDRPMEH